jgi:hypothetical protein
VNDDANVEISGLTEVEIRGEDDEYEDDAELDYDAVNREYLEAISF